MTYGVYSKDLKACSYNQGSLKDAREWCHGDRVVCSERMIKTGLRLSLVFRWRLVDWNFRCRWRWERTIYLGPFMISVETLSYTWADKIVEEGAKKYVEA